MLKRFGRERLKSTRTLTIGGGKDYPADERARAAWVAKQAKETGLAAERVETLLKRYGTTALPIIADEVKVGVTLLPDTDSISRAEIAWIARNELVVHLSDVVLRRTTLAIDGALSNANLAAIADILGVEFGWDAARKAQELELVIAELSKRHGMKLGEQPAKRR